MNLILQLPPQLEAKLDAQVRATGKARETIALELLEEQLHGEPLNGASLSAAEWVADIRSWASSHRALSHEADDTRESIYAGRGE